MQICQSDTKGQSNMGLAHLCLMPDWMVDLDSFATPIKKGQITPRVF